MSRPSDHYDSKPPADVDAKIVNPNLGVVGWLRWFWRQLTSMRTALLLLLLLAIAAVPGSLVPQRSSDPNGVSQYFVDHKDTAPILDKFQMFDVYSSAWFSAIYLLLFISLIGCVLPRTKHHIEALRAQPPVTPANLVRLPAYATLSISGNSAEEVLEAAGKVLKADRYRVARYDRAAGGKGKLKTEAAITVSAERGYMRETGNLIFHFALVGVLIAVGFGGGFGFAGQRAFYEGQAFTNSLIAFDSFNPGRFFDSASLPPYTIRLDKFTVVYEEKNTNAIGQPVDYTAEVTTQIKGEKPQKQTIKVNEPLRIAGTDVYLLGNGYAPTVTVRDPEGNVVFTDSVNFLPQDKNLTSLGVIKLPDGLAEQVGLIGFFYPTVSEGHSGAFFSMYPDLIDPRLTLDVYAGDLGLDEGIPRSVYALDTKDMTKLAGRKAPQKSLEFKIGDTVELPNGLGTVTFDGVKRFVSLDIHRDPTQGWVLVFALSALGGLLISLFIPRRRMWVSVTENADGSVTAECAGLARGDDPTLEGAVTALKDKLERALGLTRD
ncbi:cytochrome c biogenesis protein [Aurantimicrobium minutum]|uniref:cytochrome c biogenesis protein ResB n=1 Tax=Aurantimicrobium minutum TaxID=708131 RepID=UPI0024731CDB|nr:cytochrome c biogenesis protein ResB [Aurantimicrobium minutum]MDH6409763.1 cytochrome c biogenesis protein [Aurantimicrobium minutum]MDH6423970.1 cytochrome c biogenesis protein [Aurantimicrobium minutum]